MHIDAIETLLISLVKAGLLAYSSSSSSGSSGAATAVDPTKTKEFWINIGSQVAFRLIKDNSN